MTVLTPQNFPKPSGWQRVQAILDFWFDSPSTPGSEYGQQRQCWFKKDAAFDTQLRQRFEPDYQQAKAGNLDIWQQHPKACLALVLLLDQVPRNIFRGSAQSFATDSKSLAVAQSGLDQGWDRYLIAVERIFLYLPFEHSETLADQYQALRLFTALVRENPELQTTRDYAQKHLDIIQRFGRFPHRNEILDRPNTAAETEFLKQPGSRF